MKLFTKYGTRRNEIARAKREFYLRLAIIMAILIFFGATFLVSFLTPRLEKEEQQDLSSQSPGVDQLANPELNKLRAEVETIEAKIASNKEDDDLAIDEIKLIEEAVSIQRRIIKNRGSMIAAKSDIDKLEDLLERYDTIMGDILYAQSVQFENESKTAFSENKNEDALEKLGEATALQQQIIENHPRSKHRDPSRLHRLNLRLIQGQTEPIAQEIELLKTKANQLAKDKNYKEARKLIKRAVDEQQSLNENFRNSRFASLSNLKALQQNLADIYAAEEGYEVNDIIRKAENAIQEGDVEKAMQFVDEAEVLQANIITRHPESSYANSDHISRLQEMKDSAGSLEIHKKIVEWDADLTERLRNRETEDIATLIGDLYRAHTKIQTAFPNSRFFNEEMFARIDYLQEQRKQVPAILSSINQQLLDVPAFPKVKMLAQEVSQVLYEQVTGKNPSNNVGPLLPVESVTFTEATEFSKKLGWITGRTVRLPSEEEFMAAVGEVDAPTLPDQSWNAENVNREIQPIRSSSPNPNGFYDLLGNVSEWILAESDFSQRVTAAGGSVRDNIMRLLSTPTETRPINERNRFIGFRIIMDFNEQ